MLANIRAILWDTAILDIRSKSCIQIKVHFSGCFALIWCNTSKNTGIDLRTDINRAKAEQKTSVIIVNKVLPKNQKPKKCL